MPASWEGKDKKVWPLKRMVRQGLHNTDEVGLNLRSDAFTMVTNQFILFVLSLAIFVQSTEFIPVWQLLCALSLSASTAPSSPSPC